jgi:SAM-dependent methyltransferase
MHVLEIGPSGVPSILEIQVANRPLTQRSDGTKLYNEPIAKQRSNTRCTDITWTYADIHGDNTVDLLMEDPYAIPVDSESFDIVVSANVIEHVEEIWRWMPELARFCRRGGKVITVNPISWGFHEAPVDCWRIYPDGMKALYKHSGLDTNLSVFENLDVRLYSTWSILKQATRPFRGKQVYFAPPVVDNITIGTKV